MGRLLAAQPAVSMPFGEPVGATAEVIYRDFSQPYNTSMARPGEPELTLGLGAPAPIAQPMAARL